MLKRENPKKSQKHRLPICTLPMLNGKMYLINSPGLIAAGMRNRDLSFDPFSLEFAEGLLGIERKYVDMWSAEVRWVLPYLTFTILNNDTTTP